MPLPPSLFWASNAPVTKTLEVLQTRHLARRVRAATVAFSRRVQPLCKLRPYLSRRIFAPAVYGSATARSMYTLQAPIDLP